MKKRKKITNLGGDTENKKMEKVEKKDEDMKKVE